MNESSALVWLPFVKEHSPRTIVVPYSHFDLVRSMESRIESLTAKGTHEAILGACKEIGYPCFLRTDLASAKHDGIGSFKIDDEEDISNCIWRTVEDNEMKFMMDGERSPSAFLVREYLDLDSRFTAFGGLPIAREFRFFSDGKSILCWHPYWPEDSIQFEGSEPPNWKESLAEISKEPSELKELSEIAIESAKRCNNNWSVDFAQDKKGKWWLIDMAIAAESYHWKGCKNEGMIIKRDLLQEFREKMMGTKKPKKEKTNA